MLYQCPDGNYPFLVDIAPVHAGGDLNPRLRISLALFRTGLFKTGLTLKSDQHPFSPFNVNAL